MKHFRDYVTERHHDIDFEYAVTLRPETLAFDIIWMLRHRRIKRPILARR